MALPAMKSNLSLAQALNETDYQPTTGGGDSVFCKFDYQSGDFLLGRELDNIEGETVIIHTDSIAHGWTVWNNNKPTKQLVNFTEQLPIQPAPLDGNAYTESRAIMLMLDDNETQVTLEGNSYGIRSGVDDLIMAIKKQSGIPANADFLYPKVQLTSNNYKHNTGNIIYNPVFKIIDWCDSDGNVQKAIPVKKKVKAVEEKAPEAEAPAEEAKPQRRRRRKPATAAA